MELSLFSRDVIAMATAVSLSHDVFDAALMLGVCDKIVPGLLIGALQFGHLPTVFVPAGPMTSGLSNSEKSKVREQAAQGLVGREALLAAESSAYHGEGTCTFYGTANSNQMLLEAMGLHVPGTAFINPGEGARAELTREAVRTVLQKPAPIGQLVDERCIVNAMVALLATGGSTNHLIHWVAVARAAGIVIDWDDFSALSDVVPLLSRVYPNGSADVNQFQAAGGPGFVIRELLDAGLMHEDVLTVRMKPGDGGIREFTRIPALQGGQLVWQDPGASKDESVVRPASSPFSATGGLKLLQGNLGRSVIKVSAVPEAQHVIEALILDDANDVRGWHTEIHPPLLVASDLQRPNAVTQLQVVGEQAVAAGLAQVVHPLDAAALVVAEKVREHGWRRRRRDDLLAPGVDLGVGRGPAVPGRAQGRRLAQRDRATDAVDSHRIGRHPRQP